MQALPIQSNQLDHYAHTSFLLRRFLLSNQPYPIYSPIQVLAIQSNRPDISNRSISDLRTISRRISPFRNPIESIESNLPVFPLLYKVSRILQLPSNPIEPTGSLRTYFIPFSPLPSIEAIGSHQ